MTLALEHAEMGAFRDVYAPEPVAAPLGLGVAEAGGAVCGICRALPDSRELNLVVGLGLVRPAAEQDLAAIERTYGDASFYVAAAPAAQPDGLRALLSARGYTADYAWMKFHGPPDPEASAPTELRIERLGRERADDFAGVVTAAFGMSPLLAGLLRELPGRAGWTCVGAYDGDRPLGMGAMYVDGDCAWLGLGATLAAARGRGAHSAILAERRRAAAEAGCTTVTTETGVREPGRPAISYQNILRAGLAEAYARPNWRSPRA